MNLGIISHSLSLGGVEVGKRYVFSVSMSQMCASIPIYAADCLTEITDKVEAYLQKRYRFLQQFPYYSVPGCTRSL